MHRFHNRGAFLCQMAIEAQTSAIRDHYTALLAQWQAENWNLHGEKIRPELEKHNEVI